MPVPDLARLHANSQKLRPWWARAMPALAVHAARARLESHFYEAIAACVDGYDRLLQSWAKREIERLAEHYEMAAAPIREQARRLTADEPAFDTERDAVRPESCSRQTFANCAARAQI